jgi:drug/metabolite transporter (DMT)-like permease
VPEASQTRAYLALLAIMVLWGSYPAMAKLAFRDFPPLFLTTMRCVIASLFLVGLLLRSGEATTRGLTPAATRAFLVLGVAGLYLSMQLTYVAIYYTTAANVVILSAVTPVMVAVAARVYLGERLRRVQWLGVGVSALGVLVILTRGRLAALRVEELHAGDFINLVSISGWTAYTVYGKRVLGTFSPALATTGAYVMGTLLLIPTAALTTPFFPAPRLTSTLAWIVVLYQAVAGAVAHVWWYRAVEVVGPSRSAIFMNLQPLIGVALAALLLAEPITLWQLGGGLCVLVGVGLTTQRRW